MIKKLLEIIGALYMYSFVAICIGIWFYDQDPDGAATAHYLYLAFIGWFVGLYIYHYFTEETTK